VAAEQWGWHRLADRQAQRIVAAAGVRAGELVLDIGAGDGALTAAPVARRSALYAADLVLPRSYVGQVIGGRVPGGGPGYVFRSGLPMPAGAFRPPPRADCAVLVIRSARHGA